MKSFLKIFLALTCILTLVSCKAKLTKDDIVGTYTHNYEEEMEGEMIPMTDEISLNDDMTCVLSFQDDIEGTWDMDGHIITNGVTDTYEIKGDTLIYKRSDDGYTAEFKKEN